MSQRDKTNKILTLIAKLSIDKASRTLSKFVKSGARIALERTYIADISDITKSMMSDSSEVVGAFVNLVGDAPFKFLFFVDVKDSMLLSDLILTGKTGNAKEFGIYTLSAVQEMGNILASSISNVFSVDFQITLRPSPPEMVHDYVGTIFAEYITEVALDIDEVFIIESKFHVVEHDIDCHMFIVPMKGSEEVLQRVANAI